MRATAWTRADLLAVGGATVMLAASADVAQTVRDRFALDLTGLSVLERGAAALWDLRPLGTAVAAAGAVAVLAALTEPAGRFEPLHPAVRRGVAVLAGGHAALALVVLALASWVAAAGEIGDREELGFVFSGSDRAVTLVTQVAAWLPLGALLLLVALAATRADTPEPVAEPSAPPKASAPSLSEEMEALWRERLAHGPRRERARTLLGRIKALEEVGDHEGAQELADELKGL